MNFFQLIKMNPMIYLIQKLLMVLLLIPFLTNAQNINWTTLNSGTTKNINDILFLNADTGYIVGDDYLFKKTVDGGVSWVDLPAPTMGQRPGNNGNIIGIGHTGTLFPFSSSLDSGLVLVWEKPYHAVHTDDEGITYSAFNNYDTLLCFAEGFSVQTKEIVVSSYKALGMYGTDCNGGGFFHGHYAGPFGVSLNFGYYGNGGAFTSVDFGYKAIAAHEDGNLLLVDFLSNVLDTIFLDSSGVSNIAYVGNQTWYASTNSNSWNLYISTDTGKTFNVDSTFPPTFFYPKFTDMDFLSDGTGLAGAVANGISGAIAVRNNNSWFFNLVAQPIHAVDVLPNKVLYAAGDSGLVMKAVVTVGLTELEKEENTIRVFPNPASKYLQIVNNENTFIEKISLSSIDGKQIWHFDHRQNKLDVSSVPAGFYLLRIMIDNRIEENKIIILPD